jgi:hypothetical protein
VEDMNELTYQRYLLYKRSGWSDEKIKKYYSIDESELNYFVQQHKQLWVEKGYVIRIV